MPSTQNFIPSPKFFSQLTFQKMSAYQLYEQALQHFEQQVEVEFDVD